MLFLLLCFTSTILLLPCINKKSQVFVSNSDTLVKSDFVAEIHTHAKVFDISGLQRTKVYIKIKLMQLTHCYFNLFNAVQNDF